MSNPVVITGIGWITPLGHDIETVWSKMLAAQSAVAPIRQFDASTFPTTFAAEVKDYDWRKFVKHPDYHEYAGSNSAFALGAARQAWAMARLDDTGIDAERIGIYLGSGEGSLDFDNYVATNLAGWSAEAGAIDALQWAGTGRQRLDAWREIEQEPNRPLYHLAVELGARGPGYNCLTACAASTQAIGEAMEILRRGDADVMVCGGAHTMIHPFGVTGFNRLTALSTRNDAPTEASRPFSIDRDGFVLGEGAGIIILETLDHAQKRGAKPIVEVAGYGSTADAFRITDMQPDGRGAVQAMSLALEDAGITKQQVDYISAHGTSTKENDSIETRAIKTLFEHDNGGNVPLVSSIKSMVGHLIAAAGVIEAIVCTLAIRDQKLPPTINLQTPDPECDLDYVPNEARDAKVDICLSNSFGFGGQNDTLILRKIA